MRNAECGMPKAESGKRKAEEPNPQSAIRNPQSHNPQFAIVRAGRRFFRTFSETHHRLGDYLRSTHCRSAGLRGPLERYFGPVPVGLLRQRRDLIRALAGCAREHRFNLLGSGWARVVHGMSCPGLHAYRFDASTGIRPDRQGDWLNELLRPASVRAARSVWGLIDGEYDPIDWQRDFKSGYRWSEKTWYRDIRYGSQTGADVKVPWELARMQHLPQLAWAYALAKQGEAGFEAPDVYCREFCNQVLDFITQNPPRFGVNWSCSMDVAIRVANWLVACDLFRSFGAVFDPAFERVLKRSVFEHGLHIAANLEWNPDVRGNHYLANVVGLLFAAAYLPTTRITASWLEFAVRELVYETGLQFSADGANFEASTCYHRLSAEMIVYATALTLALPLGKRSILTAPETRAVFHPAPQAPPLGLDTGPWRPGGAPFPGWYWERLTRMVEFTASVTYPNGQVPQIGDNDNGRFLKLWPAFRESDGDAVRSAECGMRNSEDHLDHRHLLAAAAGLGIGRPTAYETSAETILIRGLAAGQAGDGPRSACHGSASRAIGLTGTGTADTAVAHRSSRCQGFRDFGLYILRRGRMFLVFRCGGVGQNGNGGHAHNDQLSFEFCVDGTPVIVDPGTYLYTPIPRLRNRFRSTSAHNTLSVDGREQNDWAGGRGGLFHLADRAQARILHLADDEIVAEHIGFGVPHRRSVRITEETIAGEDRCAVDRAKQVRFHLAPGAEVVGSDPARGLVVRCRTAKIRMTAADGVWSVQRGDYSPGYGETVATTTCCLAFSGTSLSWRIEAL